MSRSIYGPVSFAAIVIIAAVTTTAIFDAFKGPTRPVAMDRGWTNSWVFVDDLDGHRVFLSVKGGMLHSPECPKCKEAKQ